MGLFFACKFELIMVELYLKYRAKEDLLGIEPLHSFLRWNPNGGPTIIAYGNSSPLEEEQITCHIPENTNDEFVIKDKNGTSIAHGFSMNNRIEGEFISRVNNWDKYKNLGEIGFKTRTVMAANFRRTASPTDLEFINDKHWTEEQAMEMLRKARKIKPQNTPEKKGWFKRVKQLFWSK